MIAVNNAAAADAYNEANTFLSLSALSVTLFVFNNAVAVTILKKNPGGGQDYETLPEIVVAPGTITFPGAVGLRIRNASAGNVARFFVQIPEFDPQSPDPIGTGFVPTTATISSTGVISVAGQEYAYNEYSVGVSVSATTEATANTIVTASSFTLADSVTPIYIEFFTPNINVFGAVVTTLYVFMDGSSLGALGQNKQNSGLDNAPMYLARRLVPAAGAHIFSIRGSQGAAASPITVNAGIGGAGALVPGFIRITRAGT